MGLQDSANAESNAYSNPAFMTDRNSYIPSMLPRTGFNNTKHKRKFKVSVVDSWPYANETEEYDPHDYCTSKKPTSYCESVLHYLKTSLGTGILALPSAFKESGYAVGVSVIIFVIILYTVCTHHFISVEYELCKRKRTPHMSYATTVHTAFTDGPPRLRWLANVGKFVTNFFFTVYGSGCCAIYIIFIASNLKQLIDFYYHDDIDLRTLMAYITVPMVLICWVRNLKMLAPISAVANGISFVCFILVFWYVFREPLTFENRQAAGRIIKLPQYLTTILFSIASTCIIPPLKSEMRQPKQFSTPLGVFNISMIQIALLYSAFGFFGYVKYGDDVAGSITLNLPKDELLAQGIKGLYSLTVFVSYFLHLYIVLDVVWRNYLVHKVHNNKIMWEYIIRTLISLFTFVLALVIPNLEVFISLVGAFGMTSTSLIIPVVLHTLVFWKTFTTSSGFIFFITKNIVLFVISMVIFITGVKESVGSVIQLYTSKNSTEP